MQKYLYKDLYTLEDVHWWHRAKRQLVNYLLKENLANKKQKILDVGCGTGKNLETFSKFGEVIGIDNSIDAINFCKKRGFKAIKGDIEKMPFKSNFFDAVTALDVLEHVDDVKALKEIKRVLNQDGILIITVPAFSWLWSKWDEVLFHKRRYSAKSLKKVLTQNGFKVSKISYFFSFLVLPALIIRTIKQKLYPNHYPSDFKISNKLVNSVLEVVSGIEQRIVINYKVPIGTSLVTIAKKIKQ